MRNNVISNQTLKSTQEKNQSKPKKIKFTVYEYRSNSKKKIGTFAIDLSTFLNRKNRVDIKSIVKNPCKQQMFCTVSIQLKKIAKNYDIENIIAQFDEENDIPIDFTKEILDSSILPLESQHLIQEFFSKMKIFSPSPKKSISLNISQAF